jgi:hypothetical protein
LAGSDPCCGSAGAGSLASPLCLASSSLPLRPFRPMALFLEILSPRWFISVSGVHSPSSHSFILLVAFLTDSSLRYYPLVGVSRCQCSRIYTALRDLAYRRAYITTLTKGLFQVCNKCCDQVVIGPILAPQAASQPSKSRPFLISIGRDTVL